jgi:hypothetical protein
MRVWLAKPHRIGYGYRGIGNQMRRRGEEHSVVQSGTWVRRCLACQTIDDRRTWTHPRDAQLDRSVDTKKYWYSRRMHWYCSACGGRNFVIERRDGEA